MKDILSMSNSSLQSLSMKANSLQGWMDGTEVDLRKSGLLR